MQKILKARNKSQFVSNKPSASPSIVIVILEKNVCFVFHTNLSVDQPVEGREVKKNEGEDEEEKKSLAT